MILVLEIGCVVIGITAIVQAVLALQSKSKRPTPRAHAIIGIVLGALLILTGLVFLPIAVATL